MALELWGGCEATVHRLGDSSFDQVALTGHDRRADDLDRFAGLGVAALRFPVLWERTERTPGTFDFDWADRGLSRLRQMSIEPIVGLVHHGSGPLWTNLLDPSFETGLAAFARRVAARHPWLRSFTPVNEPLTTARFSGLYGHWHPHRSDQASFLRMLIVQVRAVRAAMSAIREVIPAARLIQTEDLGKTHATSALQHQAEFENERRWLTFDLLCGRVDRDHPMRRFFDAAGLSRDCDSLVDDPCPPDIIGVNHYLTSERFLDDRVDLYPDIPIGGNGRESYVDVEAVRAVEQPAGPAALLRETWTRYGMPVAVTEVHNGCTREEMLRWFAEVWSAALHVRSEGADIRAVTAWALMGGFDWSSLLTRMEGRYEPGVWDIRTYEPHETALARLLRSVAAGAVPDEPVLDSPGWWRRDDRFLGPITASAERSWPNSGAQPAPRPILVVGSRGTLGQAFRRVCAQRGLACIPLERAHCDASSTAAVADVVALYKPWAVINAAGFVRVDDAETEAARCARENVVAATVLASAAAAQGARFMTFSTDLVFDGEKRTPYVESDETGPLNVYGFSKVAAEAAVLGLAPDSLVIRASAFFSPWDGYNFAVQMRDALRSGREFLAANDVVISPTYVPHLVNVALDLLIDHATGVWHVANESALTWADFACEIALELGLDRGPLVATTHQALGWTARRPLFSALASERGAFMQDLGQAIRDFARHEGGAPVCGHP